MITIEPAFSRKTIKHIIRTKIDEWLETIDDEKLRQQVHDNVIVSGGAIASMMMGQKPNDYDVYFRDKETTIAVARYYSNKFVKANCVGNDKVLAPEVRTDYVKNIKGVDEERVMIFIQSAGTVGEDGADTTYEYYEITDNTEGTRAMEYLDTVMRETKKDTKDRKPYRPVFMTQNAITLSDRIQIVVRFFGCPDQIHNNYDYVHTMNYYERNGDNLVLKQEALESIMTRNLQYVGSLYPICSIFRMKKFLKRGWNISAGQIVKMASQIAEVDMSDIKVLREQLTGVDVAYLHELITAIENERKEITGKPIDSTYIIQLIDRIWNE